MPIKPVKQVIQDLDVFIPNLKKAIAQIEEVKARLQGDETFRKLWETDSAAALKLVGIDPDARMQMGLPKYAHNGPECYWCTTPEGRACKC